MSKNIKNTVANNNNNNNNNTEIDNLLSVELAQEKEKKERKERSYTPHVTRYTRPLAGRTTHDTLVKFQHYESMDELFEAVQSDPDLKMVGIEPDRINAGIGFFRSQLSEMGFNPAKDDLDYRVVGESIVTLACVKGRWSFELAHCGDDVRFGNRILINGKPPRAARGVQMF